MKNKILTLILIVTSLLSCDDYLDLVPEKDIVTIESIFNKKETALKFLNGCFLCYRPGSGDLQKDPAMCGADEFVSNGFIKSKSYVGENNAVSAFKLAEGFQNCTNPILYLWGLRKDVSSSGKHFDYYNCIRKCNIFIENVDNVYDMQTEEKERYKGEAKAMKALYYFELVRMYGPIVMVPENIPVEADIEDFQQPRSHVDTCFNRIVKLFDEAIPHLITLKNQEGKRLGLLTKDAAYAYKVKALLFAASPLFNGNEWYVNFKNRDGKPLFSSEYDVKKWEKAAVAAKEAIIYYETQGKKLYDLISDEDSDKLNVIRNVQRSVLPFDYDKTELIHGILAYGKFDVQVRLPRYNETNSFFNNQVFGCLNPSIRMVELFYTENGLPIEMDKYWHFNDRYNLGIENDNNYKDIVKLESPVLNLHLKREPRFYADIAADKTYWLRDYTYVEMDSKKGGVHGINESVILDNVPQNLTGYWVKKSVPAECKGGSYMDLQNNAPFPKARMAELYLMRAEALNEAYGPSRDVYDAINEVRQRAGIPSVEISWRNYSKQPGKIDTKDGLRDIIQQERMIEFAFEGHRFWDLRRWKKAHIYMNKPLMGWNVFGSDDQTFYNNFQGPINVFTNNKFQSPRDYFWPIKDEEIIKANIVQNLGW